VATSGTPFEGRDNLIVPLVYQALSDTSSLQMGLYTNAQDSLSSTSTVATITSPVGSGYALKTLGGNWSSSSGVVTYDHGVVDNVIWTALDNWTGGDVTGAYIRGGTGTLYLLHFKDLSLGPVTMTTGTALEVDLSTFISV